MNLKTFNKIAKLFKGQDYTIDYYGDLYKSFNKMAKSIMDQNIEWANFTAKLNNKPSVNSLDNETTGNSQYIKSFKAVSKNYVCIHHLDEHGYTCYVIDLTGDMPVIINY